MQNKTAKSKISKEFARLRKFGFFVFNFNFRSALPEGLKSFVDLIIVSKKYLIFIEVKVGEDKFSKEQKELMKVLSHLSTGNKAVHYLIINNIKDCMVYIEHILGGKL